MRVEIIIPYYNELQRLDGAVRHMAAELNKSVSDDGTPVRIWWADDGSTDGSTRKLEALVQQEFNSHIEHRILRSGQNQGKGSAMRRAIERLKTETTPDAVVVFWDSDGELHPRGIFEGLKLMRRDDIDIVFGSRFSSGAHQVLNFRHYFGNKVLTFISNFFSNLNLTDVHCCARFIKAPLLFQLPLASVGFEFEAEFVALVGRVKTPALKLSEIPVQYTPRTVLEGKKIGLAHVLPQVYQAIRCRFLRGAIQLEVKR